MAFETVVFMWQMMTAALTVLTVISLIIAYYSDSGSFAFYALYTFFLLSFFVLVSPYDIAWRDTLVKGTQGSLKYYIQTLYNSAYFLFFLYFLDIWEHFRRFFRLITRVVGVAFITSTVVFIYAVSTGNFFIFDYYYIFGFVPVMFYFAVSTLIKSFSLKGRLKYFFIFGGSVFIIFSVVALIFYLFKQRLFNIEAILYFYFGVFVEQFVFAVGLAYRVKLIYDNFKAKTIENKHIKDRQNKLLSQKLKEKERKLLYITKKAEEDRVRQIREEFENKINRVELESLQSQMNPHFLFNALNSIKVFLIENEKQAAVYYLNKFSKLIRHILESSRVESISLKEELEVLELYISLENIRFDEEISFSITNLDAVRVGQIKVPPLLLQPFVENAIWHGLISKSGKKNIELLITEKSQQVVLKIRDNGIGRVESKKNRKRKRFKRKSVGLKITRERLTYFNRKQNLNYSFALHDLYKENGKPKGTEVVFHFNTAYKKRNAG